MKARISVVSVLSVVLGLVGENALAQVDVTTGRIVGTVVDADGQPLPGATIAAKSKATGLTLTGLTDVRGTYRIVSMPVGTYSVLASLSGFGSQSEPSVVITLGSAPTVDFKLQLAPRSEAITIIGEVRAIETTRTASQTTVDNNAIRSLPINGRNFTDFVLLAPNSQRDPSTGTSSSPVSAASTRASRSTASTTTTRSSAVPRETAPPKAGPRSRCRRSPSANCRSSRTAPRWSSGAPAAAS